MRHLVLHPSFYPENKNRPDFSQPGVWDNNPSTKLSAALRIIQWHLELDGRQAMKCVEGKLEDGPKELLEDHEEGRLDKIVVYSYFNTNTASIQQVRDPQSLCTPFAACLTLPRF